MAQVVGAAPVLDRTARASATPALPHPPHPGAALPPRGSHRGPLDRPPDSDRAGMCQASWLLLTLADADVGNRRRSLGSSTPSGPTGRLSWVTGSNGGVNAPGRAGLPLLVAPPPAAVPRSANVSKSHDVVARSASERSLSKSEDGANSPLHLCLELLICVGPEVEADGDLQQLGDRTVLE
jgi:hypothetical protein